MVETLECRQFFSVAPAAAATEPMTCPTTNTVDADATTSLATKSGGEQDEPASYKMDRCFVKSWSTSGDA